MSMESSRQPFGAYELLAQVGAGRIARVYEAIHTSSGDRVAIKLFAPKMTARPEFETAFNALIESVRRLNHPLILPLYDAGKHQDYYFTATPFVEKRGLDTYLKANGPLDATPALSILEQASFALDYAAKQGVMHGSIAPGNLLQTGDGTTAISDFGLASLFARRISVPDGGSIWLVGSPNTMAPEVAANGQITAEADRYSLGATLYELLTGQPPYTGSDPAEVIRQHARAPIPLVSALRPDLPDSLNAPILAALAKSPQKRPATAADLAASFRDAIAGTGVEADETAAPVVAAVATKPRRISETKVIDRPLTRREDGVPLWVMIGAGVGVFIVAALALFLLGRSLLSTADTGPTPRPSITPLPILPIPTDIVTPMTFVPSPTLLPTPTRRSTATPRPTFTPVDTETPTPTITPTETPTETPRNTFTPGPSPTPRPTRTPVPDDGGGAVLATPVQNETYTPGAIFTLGIIYPQTPPAGLQNPAPNSILFARDGQIFAIMPDSTGLMQLTHNTGQQAQPTRSHLVAFASDRDGSWDIYLMAANGTAQTLLISGSATDSEPAWSSDGRIAFSSSRSGGTDIYVLSPNGQPVRITDSPAQDRAPNWSPTEARIVFASNRDGGDFDLFAVNADGSNLQQLTRTTIDETAPSWSPNGKQIAYLSGGNIHMLNISSGVSTQITTSGGVKSFAWSPDGLQIAFARSGDLYIIGAKGGSPIRITSGASQDSDPSWAR